MAHTYRNLWPQIMSWPNLCHAYARCRRRKRYKVKASEFDFDWEGELLLLQRQLADGTYRPGPYTNFYVYEPKKRKISAAPFRDRVVHHAVVNILEPIYERRFIYDSYACRRGKGTHRATTRAQVYLRRFDYYLKTDIIKFFPNVDHEVLLQLLGKTIRDEPLMNLIRLIVASGDGVLDDEAQPERFAGDDLLSMLRPRGLPIGNLTSQFFANVLLDTIDHFIKEELRVPGYVRYADDLLLFGNSKTQLWEWREQLARRLAKIRLKPHGDKTFVASSMRGVKFLGFALHRSGRRLPQKTIERFSRRLRRFRWLRKHRRIPLEKIRRSLRSWLAHTAAANTTGLKKSIWRRLRF